MSVQWSDVCHAGVHGLVLQWRHECLRCPRKQDWLMVRWEVADCLIGPKQTGNGCVWCVRLLYRVNNQRNDRSQQYCQQVWRPRPNRLVYFKHTAELQAKTKRQLGVVLVQLIFGPFKCRLSISSDLSTIWNTFFELVMWSVPKWMSSAYRRTESINSFNFEARRVYVYIPHNVFMFFKQHRF